VKMIPFVLGRSEIKPEVPNEIGASPFVPL
jgi:hypothetical protein